MVGLGAVTVPYDLCEERGWELRVEELHGALEAAKGVCRPVALYVINPGNPTGSDASRGRGGGHPSGFDSKEQGHLVVFMLSGHVQSRESMQEVIRFVSEKRLFLLADEVDVSSIQSNAATQNNVWK